MKIQKQKRPDKRATIEICWRSDGNGNIIPGATIIDRVVCFVHLPNGQKWAKVTSGDVWPCIPHKRPHVADFYALGGIPQ